jgi:DnaJ-class molecular chaperone
VTLARGVVDRTTTGTGPLLSSTIGIHASLDKNNDSSGSHGVSSSRRAHAVVINGNNASARTRTFVTLSAAQQLTRTLGGASGDAAMTQNRLLSSSTKRDFYKVLGVSKSADKGEIKKAYHKLAMKYHPDSNKDDASAGDKFKEASEAYEVLTDKEKKGLYDQFGHAGVDPNFAGAGGGDPFGFGGGGGPFGFGGEGGEFHFQSGGGQEIDAEELFEAFFGQGGQGGRGRGRRRGPRRGADLQMNVTLSFREAVFGCSKDLNLRYQSRAENGQGSEIKKRTVTVDIPPGIDSGMNMRLAGQGAEGDKGAQSGNLLLQVMVREDPQQHFTREGTDVHTEVSISLTQAILGGTVEIETLTGSVEMKIPKGCQPDTKMVLRGKGVPVLNAGGRKGNQIAHLKLEIPKKITPRQEELLREFDAEMKSCGYGISGRIAKAAGSAFEKFFGGSESKTDDKKNGDSNNKKKEQEDGETPKQAAS